MVGTLRMVLWRTTTGFNKKKKCIFIIYKKSDILKYLSKLLIGYFWIFITYDPLSNIHKLVN